MYDVSNKLKTQCLSRSTKKLFFRSNLQSSKVDISDLTWEQKERVLRLLFAKMNGLKTR